MSYKVYIAEQEIELKQDTVVALTKQINDLAEVKDRQLDITNRLKAPLTASNKRAFGYTESTTSQSDKAYLISDGRIYASQPLIEDGEIVVLGVGEDIEFAVSSGGLGFWKTIEGKTLHDIDWSDLDHAFTTANAAGAVSRTDGYMYPVVNFGAMSTANSNVDIRYYYPFMHLHTIVSEIVTGAGYTLSGDLLTNNLYLKSLLAKGGNKFEHSERYINERSFSLSLTAPDFNIKDFNATETLGEVGIISFGGTTRYTASQALTLSSIEFRGNVSIYNEFEPSTNTLQDAQVAIRKNGTTILGSTNINGTGEYTVSVGSTPLAVSDYLEVVVRASATVSDTLNPPEIEVTFSTGAFYTPDIDKAISAGDTITAESYLPKMSQKALLKGVMQAFAIIPVISPSAKTVKFRHFQEIIDNKPNALNWSGKLAKRPGQANWYIRKETKIGTYGKVNYLTFKEDNTLSNPDYGRGSFSSEDENLSEYVDVITLPWAATENDNLTTGLKLGVKIDTWVETSSGSGEFKADNNPKPRLIYYEVEGVSVGYTDGTNLNVVTNPAWGKFIDPSQPENLGFDNSLQATYYSGFAGFVKKQQKLEVWMKLNVSDVGKLDHFIPVWIDKFSNYYYVNKVVNFVEGKLTKVELIRI